MTIDKRTHQCFTCGSNFQFEEHVYAGKYITSYGIEVCMTCWKSNSDGWAPHYGDKIILHLKKKALPIPQMNEKGLLPRN